MLLDQEGLDWCSDLVLAIVSCLFHIPTKSGLTPPFDLETIKRIKQRDNNKNRKMYTLKWFMYKRARIKQNRVIFFVNEYIV